MPAATSGSSSTRRMPGNAAAGPSSYSSVPTPSSFARLRMTAIKVLPPTPVISLAKLLSLLLVAALPLSAASTADKALAKALAAPIVTVTDKAKPSPTGDNHDYVSYARYYWPNPNTPDGLPFVSRDGQHNREEVAAGDRGKIDLLVDNVVVLTRGWTESRRQDCARR